MIRTIAAGLVAAFALVSFGARAEDKVAPAAETKAPAKAEKKMKKTGKKVEKKAEKTADKAK